MIETSEPAVLIAAGVFLFGLCAGCLGWRRYGGAELRIRELESELDAVHVELDESQRELDGYREATARHFEQTSELFRDLTRQYAAVYGHLAEGARQLCPDAAVGLGQGFEIERLEQGGEPEINGQASPSEVQAALDAIRDAARDDDSAGAEPEVPLPVGPTFETVGGEDSQEFDLEPPRDRTSAET